MSISEILLYVGIVFTALIVYLLYTLAVKPYFRSKSYYDACPQHTKLFFKSFTLVGMKKSNDSL